MSLNFLRIYVKSWDHGPERFFPSTFQHFSSLQEPTDLAVPAKLISLFEHYTVFNGLQANLYADTNKINHSKGKHKKIWGVTHQITVPVSAA